MKRISQDQPLATLVPGVGLPAPLTAHAAATAPQPPEQTVGNEVHLSGGIGEGESAAMKQSALPYPLELASVAKAVDGHDIYLADDQSTVRNQAGQIVLNDHADRPFMLAKLPPGSYTVEAIDYAAFGDGGAKPARSFGFRMVKNWQGACARVGLRTCSPLKSS